MHKLTKYPWLLKDPLAVQLAKEGWAIDDICAAVERRAMQDEAS